MSPADDRVARLEARVRALEDVEAIRALKARYAELVDRRYREGGPLPAAELEPLAEAIAELFAEDAVWEGGPALGTCRGRDAIRERFRRPTLHFTRHYFVSPRIAVEGDRARGTWELSAPCTTRDGIPHWMMGVEEDEYVRVAGVWLHQRMHLHVISFAPHATGWVKV